MFQRFLFCFFIAWLCSFVSIKTYEASSENNVTVGELTGVALLSYRLKSCCPQSCCRYGNWCTWDVLCSCARRPQSTETYSLFFFPAEWLSGRCEQEYYALLIWWLKGRLKDLKEQNMKIQSVSTPPRANGEAGWSFVVQTNFRSFKAQQCCDVLLTLYRALIEIKTFF